MREHVYKHRSERSVDSNVALDNLHLSVSTSLPAVKQVLQKSVTRQKSISWREYQLLVECYILARSCYKPFIK